MRLSILWCDAKVWSVFSEGYCRSVQIVLDAKLWSFVGAVLEEPP